MDMDMLLSDGATAFNQRTKGMRTMFQAYWTGVCDSSEEAWPVRGHAMVLTQFTGSSVTTVLPPEIVSKESDINTFLKESDASALKACFTVHMNPGQSIWVPFGHLPVPVAVHPHMVYKDGDPTIPPLRTKAGAIQKHVMAMGATLIVDPTMYAGVSNRLRLSLAASRIKSTTLPKSYLKLAGFKTWMDNLEAAKPMEAEPSSQS